MNINVISEVISNPDKEETELLNQISCVHRDDK